ARTHTACDESHGGVPTHVLRRHPHPFPTRRSSDLRNRFVEPVRIRSGQAFWQENAAVLAEVEREYGVPAAIIVAIIGVETIYGRSEEHTSELQSRENLVCRLLLENKT